MTPYLGQVTMVGFNFAPRGWAMCNGNLMAISQNQALFAILGTTYGGDGVTTFKLPNLQGNVPMHFDGNYPIGSIGGEASHTLISTEMPKHTHTPVGTKTVANVGPPTGADWATEAANAYSPTPSGNMLPQAIGQSGNNAPHNNMQPYLVINFIIALAGTFPSRN